MSVPSVLSCSTVHTGSPSYRFCAAAATPSINFCLASVRSTANCGCSVLPDSQLYRPSIKASLLFWIKSGGSASFTAAWIAGSSSGKSLPSFWAASWVLLSALSTTLSYNPLSSSAFLGPSGEPKTIQVAAVSANTNRVIFNNPDELRSKNFLNISLLYAIRQIPNATERPYQCFLQLHRVPGSVCRIFCPSRSPLFGTL